ncbi:protein hairy-like [Neocloeon triangulifer]|uniref:protein hairy-like n=1 Tax=Neocloeon triangulifer TaxID=2078957 RepID=UPI00286F8149|nr:protein hairy-like [Neocloeon triangulifer]
MVTGAVNSANTSTPMGSTSNTPVAPAGLTPSATANGVEMAPTSATPRRGSENRRSNKPIMEKRRRARINNCLNELKSLILDAMKKDPARHSKLEKADILEMTVKHLESLQRQQSAMAVAADPGVLNKYRAGFSECASEVGRFLGRGDSPQLDPHLKRRLLAHLSNCLNSVGSSSSSSPPPPQALSSSPSPPSSEHHALATPVQVQLPPGITVSADGRLQAAHNVLGSVQLVPTCLPNGDIALVLPSHQSHVFRSTAAPVSPSPSCASSASSGASSSPPPPPLAPFSRHHPSPSPPIGFNLSMRSSSGSISPSSSTGSHHSDLVRPMSPSDAKPLSLVTRRTSEDEAKSCWRPWSMV